MNSGKKFPFEYCALRFLIQWQTRERHLHDQFQDGPTADQLRSALRYFQVARNFKGLNEHATAQRVVAAFVEFQSNDLTPEARIAFLAKRFKEDGFKHNLSAASKLWWLKYRAPYVIYDSRAVAALKGHFGERVGSEDYHLYCKAWRRRYRDHEQEIGLAVERLKHARDFMPNWQLSNSELTQIGKSSWFKERVFDIYLWELGGDG